MSDIKFTASIVLYHTSIYDLEKVIRCFTDRNDIRLFIIDNSSDNSRIQFCAARNIAYRSFTSNIGFGAAHNVAIKEAIDLGSCLHFVVNPDIYFNSEILDTLVNTMKSDSKIGMIMPQILNPDLTVQYLPKLLPSPASMLLRKMKWPQRIYRKSLNTYELRFVPNSVIYNAPILSGCFTLLNLSAIMDVGSYDESFFMYFEDWDLSRRVHKKYKTIYFPKVSVCHGYESGANKKLKLFKIFILSAINYFNRWGWFFDRERKQINKAALEQFNK